MARICFLSTNLTKNRRRTRILRVAYLEIHRTTENKKKTQARGLRFYKLAEVMLTISNDSKIEFNKPERRRRDIFELRSSARFGRQEITFHVHYSTCTFSLGEGGVCNLCFEALGERLRIGVHFFM